MKAKGATHWNHAFVTYGANTLTVSGWRYPQYNGRYKLSPGQVTAVTEILTENDPAAELESWLDDHADVIERLA